jgi:hypothetical protein
MLLNKALVCVMSYHEKTSTHVILRFAQNLGSHSCIMLVTKILSEAKNDMAGPILYAGLQLSALAHDFDFKVIARCGGGSVFDAEGVGGWVEDEMIVMEDGCYCHHQLNLGNACT